MAYDSGGGGGRGVSGDQQYGGGWSAPPDGRGGGVWPPLGLGSSSSSSGLRPALPPPYTPAVAVYHNNNATGPHQVAYQHGVVLRGPAPTPATVRALSPSPTAAPFQPARVSAPAPTPMAVVKLFITETALAPLAAAALAASRVVQLEAEKAPEVDLAPVSKGLVHPARPGADTVGKKVMIRANDFLVNVAENNLFYYDVSINPESKSRAVNREVISELIKFYGATSLGGKLPAYDGRKSLYTAGSLPFESEEFAITLVDPEKKDKERAEREYKITIRIAGRTDLFHLQQFLRGRQRDMPQETIQVLDVVLRESPSWNYVTVSRSFFSTTFGHRGDIGEGLECWRGYYQSLRPTQMGLSLNIDISATSFFKPVTVIQFVLEFLNLRDASRPLTDRDRVKIKKALRGVRVETNHQKDQIRRYKITGITPIPMSQLIFPVDEVETRMTVVQYFKDRYNYNLQHTNWPCLQSGSDSRPVYLPMEACKIFEGQRYSKKLNDKQVTNILRATCQRPQQREQSIREMVLHNNYEEDRFAQEFGIKVCSDLVSVPARVLPPPMLKYHDSGREKTCAPSVGQWNMIGKKMINGGVIDHWACLSFSRMRPEEVYRFTVDLIQMCNTTGMSVNPRPVLDIQTSSPNHVENALRDLHRRTTELLNKQENDKQPQQLQLLIVILPEISGSYGKIKKVCETDLGIVSQCCLPRHASRPNKQYMENVAFKISVKVGGCFRIIEKAFSQYARPSMSKTPTIIFGADVTHPPPGEDSASSIAAVVASMDWPEITKYRCLVSAQTHRQEIIEDLFSVTKDQQRGTTVNGGMIRELLIAFRRKTGRRPERILFYRDGVSEGQFSDVLLHEKDAIRKACASLEDGYLPQLLFIPINKRHLNKLFPEVNGKRQTTDTIESVPPVPPVYYVEGDSSIGRSIPGSSVQAANSKGARRMPTPKEQGECPVEVRQLPRSKENARDPIKPVIWVRTPVGKLSVEIDLTEKCSALQKCFEEQIQHPVDNFWFRSGSQNTQSDKTLEFYGLQNNSDVYLYPRMRGGAIGGSSNGGSQNYNDRLDIVSQDSDQYYDSEKIPHKTEKGRTQRTQLFNSKGSTLATSLVDIFLETKKDLRSWNGRISARNFRVVNGKAVLIPGSEATERRTNVYWVNDCKALADILRQVFKPSKYKNFYFDDLIEILEKAQTQWMFCSWLDTYLSFHLVCKTPLQRCNVSWLLMKFFENWTMTMDNVLL